MSSYEIQRELNLKKNNQKLKELGLLDLKFNKPEIKPVQTKKKKNIRRRQFRVEEKLKEKRVSKRLSGAAPEFTFYEANLKLDNLSRLHQLEDDDKSKSVDEKENIFVVRKDDYFSPFITQKVVDLEEFNSCDEKIELKENGTVIEFPVQLESTNVEILKLGKLITEPSKIPYYWSNKNCKYVHPYPVGFKSKKLQFGDWWYQSVLEGDTGPVFEIVRQDGRCYQGSSPTAAWNLYLENSNRIHGATKISGPNFFGFSDTYCQKLIKNMDGYDLLFKT
ncbi:hypothetical protein HDU92_007240 [Lobulomyces angularis]|nr:hypothetical protein HDU92_007240 [Lobulomyces angularis]